MNLTIKRVLAFCAAIVVCLSTFLVGASATIPEDEQQFWSVFDYNNVNMNMGLTTFRNHWNKARDQMPLLVYFGTQRVGYSTIRPMQSPLFNYIYQGDDIGITAGSYHRLTYIGHGNGFIYAGADGTVPSELCYMGHLFVQEELVVNSGVFRYYVDFYLVKGGINEYSNIVIDDGNGNSVVNTDRSYSSLSILYNYVYEFSDSGGDSYYDGYSNFVYRTNISSGYNKALADGDYYGFMFGQTAGSVYNGNQNGSPESIFYAWFNGPFGIDEETDGMTGQRFGMVSPIFYQEGYETFYTPIYNEGYNEGYDVGYTLGDINGYNTAKDVWYNKGLIDGFNGADTSQAWSNMKNLIFSIFDAPFYVISYSLDFDLFGINIAGTLIALISTALIVWILKIILVKLF